MHIVDSAKRLVKYSWLLQVLVERDLKIRYRRSFLGYLWSVLNPLLMMIILTIVFSNMFRFDIPQYPVYLLAGQLIFRLLFRSYQHGDGFYFRRRGPYKKSVSA